MSDEHTGDRRARRPRSPREALSRLMAYMLRHHPEEFGLALDEEGWTGLDSLLEAARSRRGEVSVDDVEEAVNASEGRYEISEDRIRATYGHTTPLGATPKAEAGPPPVDRHRDRPRRSAPSRSSSEEAGSPSSPPEETPAEDLLYAPVAVARIPEVWTEGLAPPEGDVLPLYETFSSALSEGRQLGEDFRIVAVLVPEMERVGIEIVRDGSAVGSSVVPPGCLAFAYSSAAVR